MSNSKYASYENSDDDNTSSDGNDFEDYTLKWKPQATFRGTLKQVFGAGSRYGQTFGIKFENVSVIDGVLMRRVTDDGNPDGTLKLFDWGSMPIVGEPSVDDVPQVHTEEFGGNTFTYELVGARLEEQEEPGEPIEITNDVILWEGGGQAPSATAKTLAQLFTNAGNAVINDRNDINNWLNTSLCTLRSDLEGRTVDVFKIIKSGEEHNFHSPIVIDTKTGEQVLTNNESSGQGESESGRDNSPTESGGEESNASTQSMPEPVRDFVEFCVDFNLADESQIRYNMNDMARDSDNSLEQSMIENVGEDNIVAAIRDGQ